MSHPKDPFHRIDVLAASRHVRFGLDGAVLAESARPTLLFETLLPTRYYLPRDDVRAELVPSPTRTFCAYKGEASYFSLVVGEDGAGPGLDLRAPAAGGGADPRPGLLLRREHRRRPRWRAAERPVTPWSRR